MEEWRARYEQLRERWNELSLRTRVLVLSAAGVVVAASLLTYASQHIVNHEVLFSNLAPEDAAEVVERLRDMRVPYELESGGTAVLVPSERVHETRLTLAAEGLPSGGGVGFELFDEPRFGESEFSEHVKYHRALEGELARTISHISGVDSARVHLVLPERTLFVSNRQPASASVVLRLRPGWQMREDRVRGIVNLVTSSVRGLEAGGVTVVDGQGRQLNEQTGEAGEAPTDALDFRRRIEEEKAETLQELLDQTLGPGVALVRIAADVSFTREERTEEVFDPNTVAPRSFQVDEERDPNGAGPTAGVPGAVSNLPGGDAPPEPATRAGLLRRSETRNFEVSKTVRHAVEPVGRIRRLNVAVVVDGLWEGEGEERTFSIRSDEELAQIRTIVSSAAGIDEERGDRVTVECVAFPGSAVLPPEEEPDPLAEYRAYLPYAAAGAGALLVLIFLFAFWIWRRKRRKAKAKLEAEKVKVSELAAAKAGELPAGEGESDTAEGGEDDTPKLPALTKADLEVDPAEDDIRLLAAELAEKDPELAARVIRSWLIDADGLTDDTEERDKVEAAA